MKYGLLTTSILQVRQEEQYINIGDMFQTIAIASVYEKMGISKSQIVEIDINQVSEYDGEYVVLPININLSLNWCVNIFPLPERILPVFLGLSYFSAGDFPADLREYFKTYSPIGCRDEQTLELMRRHGIPAYLFGCITATLPRRPNHPDNGKVYLVDLPDVVFDFIPPHLRQNSESFSHIYYGDEFFYTKNIYDAAYRLLKKYQENAALVITSRLHALVPCMAMGIPVIAVPENCSPRMAWVDRFVPIYSPDQYEKINWNPKSIHFENIKQSLIQIAIMRIRETVIKYQNITDISYFYESRTKSQYGNFYLRVLEQFPVERGDAFEYILWGAGQIGINAYQIISQKYPKSKLVAVVDSFCEGEFFGVKIERPNVLSSDTQAYIFIATYSGEQCAIDKLSQIGKCQGQDYLSFATKTG